VQADTVTDAAELELKNKELELKETAQLIDMLKSTAMSKQKEEQSQLNRDSKESIKEAELQTKIDIEQAKLDIEKQREFTRIISEMIKKQMDDQKEMDTVAMENLIQLANEQMKEMTNDEER
jgi:hypothetical protein